MILVDTSVWIDHLRKGDALLEHFLSRDEVLTHAGVIGELALGFLGLKDPRRTLLTELPQAQAADDDEVLRLIDLERLQGSGIGYVDAHLLASVRLTINATLWTRDKRLAAVADRLMLSAVLTH